MIGLSTSALRTAWAPACQPKGHVYLEAFAALDAVFKHHGYEVRKADTGAYNCRHITGGAGFSLHSYGPGDRFTFWTGVSIQSSLAVDVNWQTNPYGPHLKTDMPRAMVDDVYRIRCRNGKPLWRWGGDYQTNKDAMHFEIVCTPADLATGVDPATLPGATTWVAVRPGDTDRHVHDRGGSPAQVSEVQRRVIQWRHDHSPSAPDPGPIDGAYGPKSVATVRAFKRWVISLQHSTHQTPWPNDDGIVGSKTIGVLRFWAP